MDKTLFLRIVLVFGMLVSLFLAYEHFAPEAEGKFCTFGENFNCGVINKGPYANLDGFLYLMVFDLGWNVPYIDIAGMNIVLDILTSNAVLGLLTLILVFVMSFYRDKRFLFIEQGKVPTWMFGILLFGIGYGCILFLVQHFFIKFYCIYCLALDAALITGAILVYKIKGETT